MNERTDHFNYLLDFFDCAIIIKPKKDSPMPVTHQLECHNLKKISGIECARAVQNVSKPKQVNVKV